ncbi:hypothetical protein EDD15DRAFT_2203731 [Pisolithus albus]|nr:hypothetical protein EDD15DRAFT_2205319 [Pisolithus albus]KAI5981116.1 hypothetical protein EDD15DRAFT_2204524 [Pisolithus albus]KAI5981624.1 hypothetical protein EDD15DRAFT_2203731 [Pisolithus albus]
MAGQQSLLESSSHWAPLEVDADESDFPIGSLFPFGGASPLAIQRFLQLNLVANISGDHVEIIDIMTSTVVTTAPMHYWELIRRFLWRRGIYHKLLNDNILDSFSDHVANSVRCNAVHLNSVFHWIRQRLATATNSTPPGRVKYFEAYMHEEFYVGRHEPSALIIWQKKNPTTNLWAGDILSEEQFDWQYVQERFGEAWEGKSCRWNVQTLNGDTLKSVVEDCETIFDTFYDHPYTTTAVLPGDSEESRCYGGDVTKIIEDTRFLPDM